MFKKIIPWAVVIVLLAVCLFAASGQSSTQAESSKTVATKSEYCPPCPECPDGKTTAIKTATENCETTYCPPCPECPEGKAVCKDAKCETSVSRN